MATEFDKYFKAVVSGIGKQDTETFFSFYEFAESQLKTPKEREALRLGTMAKIAEYYRMPLRRAFYTFKFKRAYRKILKGGDDNE